MAVYDTTLTSSVVLDGLTIPFNSVLSYANGQHTGADNQAVLTDSTAVFPVDGYNTGFKARNTSDNSEAPITDGDDTTITGTLAGGTDNDWDTDDYYEITVAGIVAGDIIYYSPTAIANAFNWQLYDDSDGSYSDVYTYTIAT